MAHPYNSHREDHVAKQRVSHITHGAASGGSPKCYAAGGAVSGGANATGVPSMRADGGAVKGRSDRPCRARGGKVKKGPKGHKTNVNVIVAPSGGAQAGLGPKPPMPVPPAPPPAPPMPPMAAKPPMPPMPPAPGGGMPPPPMRARGGPVSAADKKGLTGIGDRTPVQSSGTNKQDTVNIGRKAVITKATGGPINAPKGMGPHERYGGKSGLGRLDKAHRQAKKGHPSKKAIEAGRGGL